RMAADDPVLVEGVVLVVAGPGVHYLGRLEGWHALGQDRPDHLLPFRVLDLERREWRIVARRRRRAGQVEAALRPEPDARGVDGERQQRQRRAAVEDED